jgi:hypothetical protein
MKKLGLLLVLSLMCLVLTISSFAAVDSYSQNFESYEAGTEIKDDLLPDWSLIRATPTGSFIREEGGNKYFAIDAYYHAEYTKKLTEPYVYEVDVYNPDAKFNVSAFFVRAGSERFDVMFGKSTGYEWDGDGNSGFPSVGGSGLLVLPNNGNKLSLVVKTYDESKEYKIGNVRYEATVGADFSKGFETLKFVDDGQTVKVYASDELAFIVEMSDAGTYPVGEETYYKKVVVKDKNGTELGTVNNARVSVDSVLIIGCRESKFNIDNIKIYALEEPNTETYDAVIFMPVIISAVYVLAVLKRRQVA